MSPKRAPSIPKTLRARRQWVAYRLEPNRDQPDKPAKIPYSASTQRASHADPDSWLTHKDAATLARTPGFAGVGYVFSETDPYVGIDLDGCRDPNTGEVAEWATRIIDQLDSYTELSQSGTGFHIIVRGTLPDGIRHQRTMPATVNTGSAKAAKLEVYDRLRFFVMTGQATKGRTVIRSGETTIPALVAEHLTPTVPGTRADLPIRNPHLLDETVCDHVEAAHPQEFHRLYVAGETRPGKSESESDYQLACMFAAVVGGDTERIDRLMRGSALERPKWNERRGEATYLAGTIARAINSTLLRSSVEDTASPEQTYFATLSEIRDNKKLMHKPQALIPHVAWTGRVTLFAGREKLAGKSTFLTCAVSCITRGTLFLDMPTAKKPRRVLWISADEEHTGDVVHRSVRFDCDTDMVALLYPEGSLKERLAMVEEKIRAGNPRLVVVDTLSSFARVQDPFSSKEWPEVILYLKRLAREHNLAMVLVHHTSKNQPEDYRDSTSIGATVDQIVSLAMTNGSESTHRRLKSRGRLSGATETTVTLDGNSFRVVSSPMVTRADRIREYLNEHGEASQTAVERAIGGDNKGVRKLLTELVTEGLVSRRKGEHGASLYSLVEG